MKHYLSGILFLLMFLTRAFAATVSNQGADFWLTFPHQTVGNSTQAYQLYISSQTAVSGTVAMSSAGFSQSFTIPAGGMTVIDLPASAGPMVPDNVVTGSGIHVTANGNVAVYGFGYQQYATDAYLALPVSALGSNYMIENFPTEDINGTVYSGEFSVAAPSNGTVLTIVPSVTTQGHSAGVPYTVTLNRGDVYELMDQTVGNDLTGTIINSNKPVAVFQGNEAADVPSTLYTAANYLVEEAWPVADWGTQFVTVPLATRSNGDLFKVTAYSNGTQVAFNGTVVATLNAGQSYSQELTASTVITANQAINVMQFSNGSSWDGSTGDPYMITVPSTGEYDTSYIVGAPQSNFSINYINLTVPTSVVGSITLNGSAIPAGSFSPIGSSGFSNAQVPVSPGTNRVSGPVPFGAASYGFDQYDGYGYPGALVLIANPPTFTPTPTGTQATPTNTPTGTLTVVIPTATDTPTPTESPTPTNTPTVTPTLGPRVDDFYVSKNIMSASDPVSIHVATNQFPGHYELRIYNSAGEHIKTLSNKEMTGPLVEDYLWDGKNKYGDPCASGVYIFYLIEPFGTKQRRIILMR
ncbi:MAG TPA: IgGFc-binding protein [bacterium]|nr:IgGFc-binding protein [bacterium]